MDSEQAKLILSTYRSTGADPEERARLAEALDQVAKDPALEKWWAEQKAFDDTIRKTVRSIEPPPGLRASILNAARPAPARPEPRFSMEWLALAAALILGLGVSLFAFSSHHRVVFASLDRSIPALTAAHNHSFVTKPGNLAPVRDWLAKNGGIADFQVPEGLHGAEAVACEVTSVQGAKVTILCFSLGAGRIAHLYVMDRAQFSDPPSLAAPQVRQLGNCAVASWSAGNRSYILAEIGTTGSLRNLL